MTSFCFFFVIDVLKMERGRERKRAGKTRVYVATIEERITDGIMFGRTPVCFFFMTLDDGKNI